MHLEKLLLVVQNQFQQVEHLAAVSGSVTDQLHGAGECYLTATR